MNDRPFVWLLTGQEGYGVLSTARNLAVGLKERGLPTAMAVLQEGRACEPLESAGLRVVRLGLPSPADFAGGLLYRVKSVLSNELKRSAHVASLRDALAPLQPRVLHWLGPNLTSTAAPAARSLGAIPAWEIPNLIGVSDRFGIGRWMYQQACRRWQVEVFPNSECTDNSIVAPGVRTTVNYACVDDSKFVPDTVEPITRDELGITKDSVVVTVIARLHQSKGQLNLLRAIVPLLRSGVELTLLLVGGPLDSPLADDLRDACSEFPDALKLIGPTSHPERYYPITDLAVNARIDPEPFGMSVIEAMLMKRPVLVHASGGPAETVVDGVTGWHAPDPSPETLRSTIERALADRSRWKEMGEAGRERALRLYSKRVIIDRYLEVIERAERETRPR